MIQIPGRAEVRVEPLFNDAFAGPVLGILKFSRGARGNVTGFTVKTGDVRSLQFDRVK